MIASIGSHLLAVVAFALACGAWVLLQRWVARRAPDVKGPESGCGSCSCGDGACSGSGARAGTRHC
jgi:hypothetical protein